jgi:hypothetical protein
MQQGPIAVVFLTACLAVNAQQPSASGATSLPPVNQQPVATDLHSAQTDEGKMLTSSKIPAGSKIYISPMEGGFENFVVAGMQKKQVPLVVVIDRAKADYEMSGISDSEKAGWAKMLILGSQQSNEEASVKVSDLKTGSVVFAYSVHKTNSYKGKQSAGEACAKHLKDAIE